MKRTNPGSEPLIEWRATPPRALPPTAGLHLWRIRTDARGADLAEAAGLLDAPQRARAEHLRHAPMRERYIRAQSGLRRVLGHYFGIDPRLIRFTHGPAGKPDLPPELGVCSFNLTTTGDLALVAIGAGRGPDAELGVDCEHIRPRVDVFGVAARMFTPEVESAIRTAPEPERLLAFYRAWTALEADAKSNGRGLFKPRPSGARPPQVRHCIPADGYLAAVARAQLPDPEQWHSYDLT